MIAGVTGASGHLGGALIRELLNQGIKVRVLVRNDKRAIQGLPVTIIKGDILDQDSGGGGGYGDPLDREVEKVRWDVLNEYVSIEAAKDVYGVVIDPETFVVDDEATKKLREKLKKKNTE